MTVLTVVIAPDSFKGTAPAQNAARAIADGWASVRPADRLVLLPMADGGEGTLDAFDTAVPHARRMPVEVQGPDNQPVASSWLLLPDGTGVVELANTSGLTLLNPLRPLDAHTLGFGQAIGAALDHGVDRLLLALGGSASTDGGAGAMAALGALFVDATNRPIRLGNRGLGTLAKADLTGLRELPAGGAQILCDVTNPLLGPNGAAAVFGPQKGATEAQVRGLESNLTRLARLIRVDPSLPGAGAAGGTAFGLLAWGATLAPGAAAIGEALGVPAALAGASVLITGEGRFDAQSAAGKVPSYLLQLAADAGVPAMLVAGSIEADTAAFAVAQSLTTIAGSGALAMADPLRSLRAAGAALAREVDSAR
ncbi:glycerate kinase [Leifsonia kafniensis]|uniref:Glycerate kinase n=1 Tax=Leifsonia kafniensis TaxID=475957 RepID=A0ABP7L3A9_9MICO